MDKTVGFIAVWQEACKEKSFLTQCPLAGTKSLVKHSRGTAPENSKRCTTDLKRLNLKVSLLPVF